MKRNLVDALNLLLRPLGVRVVRSDYEAFKMSSAIRRIAEHQFEVNSIIDIGASDGKWSLSAMSVFPNASFLAIEPLKERLNPLEDCKRRFKNFDYQLCVAGEHDSDYLTLNVADDLDGSTVGGNGGVERKVPVRSLDSLVYEKGLVGPFLIKFDTHGYEIPILNGSTDTLVKTNVIIMETYNFQITEHALRFHEMCFHMEKLGFRCYDMAAPMLRVHDKSFWQMDMFFCRNDSKIFSWHQYI